MYTRDWRTALQTPPTYRLGNRTFRFHFHAVLIFICFGSMAILFIYTKSSTSSSENWVYRTPSAEAYNTTYHLTSSIVVNGVTTFRIGLIADLDTNSKIKEEPPAWRSYYKKGYLKYDHSDHMISVSWDTDAIELRSYYSLKDRGMELSELIVFNGRLLTFDDRTGIVYEILNDQVIPWIILTDGDGRKTKGFKSEWATVKNNMLYVGSMGKEWTTSGGEYENDNPMFVKVVSSNGEVRHINWSNNYKAIREVLGIIWPGYMIHESGMWSHEHKRWYFLPRRCSKERYNETRDEFMGCKALITADEYFTDIKSIQIGKLNPTRGYSSFKFVPGTGDKIIVAISTEEVNGKTATYISAFSIEGKIFMEEKKIPTNHKYEGIEFI